MIPSRRAFVVHSPLPAGLFITGTDTGVGKTVVTSALVRWFRQQRQPVRVCKPVATGARRIGNRWVSDDTVQLVEAAGIGEEWEQITPWTWPEPVAPPVAARCAGAAVTLNQIVAAVRARSLPEAPMLVEGVGGLLCPLTETHTVADLATALRLPLLVVTRRSLGTLNHTLLTLEAAARRNLEVAGVVINETSRPQGLADETNVDELRQRLAVPILAVVPHQEHAPIDALPALAAVDWRRLCFSDGCRSRRQS
jgi:dethiobiotin synthetase